MHRHYEKELCLASTLKVCYYVNTESTHDRVVASLYPNLWEYIKRGGA